MNTLRTVTGWMLVGGLLLALASALTGCDVESVDSTTAVPSDNSGKMYNYSGLYMPAGTNVTVLVFPTNRQSGVKLTWLRLLQYGSVLEGYDSANQTWSGKISSISEGNASFTLNGATTAGNQVNLVGSLRYAEQSSTMDATWIEPGFSGSIFARAAVSSPTTNAPVSGLTLTANPASVGPSGSSTLTAAGGTEPYSWPSSASFGTLSGSGSTATYTRTSGSSSDSVTITVTSGSASKSVTIEFD